MEKKIKVHIIFFTYKRAILLDGAISSLIKNFKNISYPISVIYHYDKTHEKSYNFLKHKYKGKIIFFKRKKKNILQNLNLFLNPFNIFFILRWPKIFTEYNSFKTILENIIYKTKKKYIMLCPDDIFFYKTFKIPEKLFEKINKNPKQYFIRPAYGKNITSFNLSSKFKMLKFKDKSFVQWSNDDPKCSMDMKYNFHVDAAVYEKKALLNLISKIIYNNPVTLEANGFKYSKLMRLYKKTISPFERVCSTYQINSVQTYTNLRFRERLQVKSKMLDKLYLKGYKILHKINNIQKNKNDIIPKNIFLRKKNKTQSLQQIIKTQYSKF